MIEASTIESIDTAIFATSTASHSRCRATPVEPSTSNGSGLAMDPFDRIIGQTAAVGFLRRLAEGISFGGEPDPILLQGRSGRGKTLLATAFAETLALPLISIQCGREVTPAAFIEKIAAQSEQAVIFLDEIHSLSKGMSETLFMAIDQAQLPALHGRYVDRIAPPVAIVRHVWVAASNLPGSILRALRSRLLTISLADYSPCELEAVATRKAESLGLRIAHDAIPLLVRACTGSPRVLGHLLNAVAVTTTGWRYDRQCEGLDDTISLRMVEEVVSLMGIDQRGLDSTSRALLDAITRQSSGSMSAEALSMAIGLDVSYVRERLAELRIRGLVIPRPGSGWSAAPGVTSS